MGRFAKSQFWYHIMAAAVGVVWGVTFVSSKVLINAGMQPAEIMTLRFILAYLCLLPFSLAQKDRLVANSIKDELLLILLGISGGSLYFLFENSALVYTQASNVSILIATTPLWTMLASTLFTKDLKVKPRTAIFSLISLAGVVIVVLNGQTQLHLHPLGDLLTLGAAFTWVLYSLILKVLDTKYSVSFITRKVFFYGIITMLPYFLIKPWGTTWAMLGQTPVLLNLVFLGIVASFLGYIGWNAAQAKLGPVKMNLYLYINPIATALVAVPVLGERFTWITALGTILILGGMYFAMKE